MTSSIRRPQPPSLFLDIPQPQPQPQPLAIAERAGAERQSLPAREPLRQRRPILGLSQRRKPPVPGLSAGTALVSESRRASEPNLATPSERDEMLGQVAAEPQPVIEQAKADLDAGLVDTELRGAAGLDDERRRALLRESARGDVAG